MLEDGPQSEELKALLAQANAKAAQDPFGALELAVQAMRMQGSDEAGIISMIQTAKANHKQVVVSQQRPGVGWERLGGGTAGQGMSAEGLIRDATEARCLAQALLRQGAGRNEQV